MNGKSYEDQVTVLSEDVKKVSRNVFLWAFLAHTLQMSALDIENWISRLQKNEKVSETKKNFSKRWNKLKYKTFCIFFLFLGE